MYSTCLFIFLCIVLTVLHHGIVFFIFQYHNNLFHIFFLFLLDLRLLFFYQLFLLLLLMIRNWPIYILAVFVFVGICVFVLMTDI